MPFCPPIHIIKKNGMGSCKHHNVVYVSFKSNISLKINYQNYIKISLGKHVAVNKIELLFSRYCKYAKHSKHNANGMFSEV